MKRQWLCGILLGSDLRDDALARLGAQNRPIVPLANWRLAMPR